MFDHPISQILSLATCQKRSHFIAMAVLLVFGMLAAKTGVADEALLKAHCAKCHENVDPEGDFSIRSMGAVPTEDTVDVWEESLELVRAEDMPPADESQLSDADRARLVKFLDAKIRAFNKSTGASLRVPPRRLNNRELENSISDILFIEDVGSHQPTANLLGDSLEDGFDTNGEALGMSEFHLEQYIEAYRKILDATILSGERPETRRYEIDYEGINMHRAAQNSKRDATKRNADSVDFLDLRRHAYFADFETVPETGRYRFKIRVTGVDRGYYDEKETGIYSADPIRLSVHFGDRIKTFNLVDEEEMVLELDEWLAAGTHIKVSYPTDGLRLRGNGNFKFQYAIAGEHIQTNDPKRYEKLVQEILKTERGKKRRPESWHHWTEHWRGPRPRLFGAEIEGPIYDSWPPKRTVALVGENPSAENATSILLPIAKRAWRRDVEPSELEPMVRLVQSRAEQLGDIGAIKEGIVAILVSPSFLLINLEELTAEDRFATKLSYFLKSTSPDTEGREAARKGKLDSYDQVLAEVKRQLAQSENDEFLREFPHAWMQLDRINFMAPDPEHFRLYDRKRISDDMIDEVLHFFKHAVDNNVPVPELISADYSFLNADLAKVYGVEGIPQDSKLRKYTFKDGRRGGLLGLGAFLTLTADSLGTSPIHRAVYVMENFLGIHPTPPPPNVVITEPDVRQAKTIKEILAAHTNDPTCASCHDTIDPYGYAFENFDPMGAWRDEYTMQVAERPSRQELNEIAARDKERKAKGLEPLPRPWENEPIPIESSSEFRNGSKYENIVEFRKLMKAPTSRDRFVRCFITKLLTYANGVEPDNYTEVEKILEKSAEHDYRIVETIAAVIDSPLFREE